MQLRPIGSPVVGVKGIVHGNQVGYQAAVVVALHVPCGLHDLLALAHEGGLRIYLGLLGVAPIPALVRDLAQHINGLACVLSLVVTGVQGTAVQGLSVCDALRVVVPYHVAVLVVFLQHRLRACVSHESVFFEYPLVKFPVEMFDTFFGCSVSAYK